MSHQEEQEMEAEALTAIFDNHFTIIQAEPPFRWQVELWPEATEENHVGAQLTVTLPENYPDEALPQFEVSVLKGLTQDHEASLLELAQEEAENNMGGPSIFAICERLREWLVDNNQKGHDDVSMHAQMLRRKAEAEKKEQQQQAKSQQYEAQKTQEEMTETEREELELRRRRAEGTPVNKETFEVWKAKFEEEMRLLREQQEKEDEENKKGGKQKKSNKAGGGSSADDHKKGRLTGFQQFSDTAFNLEALEAAAENAQRDPDEDDDSDQDEDDEDNNGEGIKEELFDVDDDEVDDLDDLDFDDDDEEEEDDEEEVDI